MNRKKLSDILRGGTPKSIARAWESTEAAKEFEPLPAGVYVCLIVGGEPSESKGGTPGYRITFEVIEGKHSRRRLWLDLWLTQAALPMTKRDLAKLGVSRLEQLDAPPPPGIVCKVRIVLNRDDDGTERNRVRGFDVSRIEPPKADPFAPGSEVPDTEPAPIAAGPTSEPNSEPESKSGGGPDDGGWNDDSEACLEDGDAEFPFGNLAPDAPEPAGPYAVPDAPLNGRARQ